MYETLSAYILGVALAVVTCFPASALNPRVEQRFFTVIMIFVAIGFFGFPLEQGDMHGTVYELLAMAVFLLGILLGWKWNPVFLPLTFLAHGSWDLAYLTGVAHSVKPSWIVELCVPYDWLVAVYLLTRVGIWRSGI